MHYRVFVCTSLSLLILVLTACSPAPAPEPVPEKTAPAKIDPQTPKWTATEGIAVPESAYLDSASGFLFVSEIVGMADVKDGDGRISKLSPDGKVIDASWITGLNAPKGMRSYDGVLWTADIDEVVGIGIAAGKIKSRVKIKNAKFLNDVACGPDGTVYVTDMTASKIYAVKNNKATVFAEGDDIEYPNGLLVEGDHLVVGGWGKPEEDFTTKVPGRLFKIDLKTKKKSAITPDPIANIDGLESDGAGGYILTDWTAGKVLHINAQGKVHQVTQFNRGTADISYVPATHLLIIPHMQDNKVAEYDISDALQ